LRRPPHNRLTRLARAAAAAAIVALTAAAAPTSAQVNLAIATAPGSPPIANAVTHGLPSSISFTATNTKAGTQLRQIEFRLASSYTIQGGLGPPGWTVTRIVSGTFWTIRFQVADCAVGGIASGGSGTFRVDTTPPAGTLAADATDALNRITPSDPCGGTTGWTVTSAASVTWLRKVLQVTGTVAPAQGAPPVAATATWTVKNLSSATKNGITPTTAVTPSTGFTGGTCLPPSLSLAPGASGNFTCTYSITTPGSYAFAATAGTAGATAVGASAGSVRVGAATATFAFDSLSAGRGDRVRATLTVRNNGASAITATPPGYAALVLTNLTKAAGATDPAAASVPAGATRDFVYSLDVTGLVGSKYVAQGTASTTAGNTNVAVTPAGTVSASLVDWTPPAVVKARTASPYLFTVTVVNGSATAVSEVDVVNPQNGSWTVMANQGTSSPLGYRNRTINGAVTTLRYTGTLAAGATATIHFQFTGVPTVAQTTAYPFQVVVVPSGGGQFSTTYAVTASVAIPIPDVSGLTVASNSGGQVLAWTNTGRTDAPHDGVVVFRTAAPSVPRIPADFVDYTVPANQPADFFYADRDSSAIDTIADPAVGAYNYRVCNRDALGVFSACNTGFWNGAGWIDSAIPPAGGWTHQLGGAVLLLPGVVPGNRVGITSNAPSVTVLDLATGDRAFDPIPLSALPSNGTPAGRMGNGKLLLFAADNGGLVTAFDLEAGTTAWQVTKTGESFVAGVAGITRSYAPAAFQAAYNQDVLFLPSTTGRLLAVDAWTGATLWTVSTGAAGGLRARIVYDYATNKLYVPASGGGVLAYDLGTSSSTKAPTAAAGFTNPGGAFRLGCVRASAATDLACVDASGNLVVLDRATGAVKATLATGASSPSSLWPVGGTAAGFVVGNASRVVRVNIVSPPSMSLAGTWAPAGVTLSPVQVFVSDGWIYVGGSDKKLHKLRLSDAGDTGMTASITPQAASVLLGPPGFDVVNNLFVFGTDDGRVWAVKSF